jgi:hypothetical protein
MRRSGGDAVVVVLEASHHQADRDMHGAFDVVAGAAMALAGAGGPGLREQGSDLAGATAAIWTAAEAVISLARSARTTPVRRDRTLDLPAG